MANPSQEVLELEPFVQNLQNQLTQAQSERDQARSERDALQVQVTESQLSPEARAALDRLTAMAASASASAPSAG